MQLSRKLKLFIILWISHIYRIRCFTIPRNPCPEIFKYQYDGTEWFGFVELRRLRLGPPIQLNINLSLKARLTTSYLGAIELFLTREETARNIYENKPVLYKIHFPVPAQLPRITQIVLNNRVICSGPAEFGSLVTSIKLEHTLHTELLAKQLEAKFDQDMEERPIFTGSTRPDITCGRIHPNLDVRPLIIGGDHIQRGSWPWLVAIYLNVRKSLSFQCGGNLLSRRIVLASAHCFAIRTTNYLPKDILVFLGRHNLREWSEPGSIASAVEEIFIHPDYDQSLRTFDADLAVVLLRKSVEYNEFIRPVCLWAASFDSSIENQIGIVVGWGRNESNRDLVTEPKRAEVTTVSDSVCLRSNEQFHTLTSNRTLCAGSMDGSGPCSGDSGSGLMFWRNNKWTLRGVVSASLSDPTKNSCDLAEFVIFVDVSKFLDWMYLFLRYK